MFQLERNKAAPAETRTPSWHRVDRTLETETEHFEWPSFELQTNDAVELRVLDNGDGDAPMTVRRSSDSPQNLFANVELAKELLTLVSDFESRLLNFLRTAEKNEAPEEHKKLTSAVGRVVWELGNDLLYPVYRRHQELVPEQLRGELL